MKIGTPCSRGRGAYSKSSEGILPKEVQGFPVIPKADCASNTKLRVDLNLVSKTVRNITCNIEEQRSGL